MSSLFHHIAGNDKALDFTGAFVDLRDTCVSVIPLHRHVRNVTHATQNLQNQDD